MATPTNDSLHEFMKELGTDLNLYRHKELLLNGAAHRDVFDKFNYLNLNVIDNPHVPAGSYYLVDKKDMWIGRYDKKYEVEAKETYNRQHLQQWMATIEPTMRDFHDKALIQAIGGGGGSGNTFTCNVPENACDACRGTGVFSGETCWHCLGDGDDPTK